MNLLDKKNYNNLKNGKLRSASYYSLRIALFSYFNTYSSVQDRLEKGDEAKTIDKKASEVSAFVEDYIRLWLHLQHFFELEIKRILVQKNKLLIVDPKSNTSYYCDNVLGKRIEEKQYSSNTVGFSEALERLEYLYKKGYLSDETTKLFIGSISVLKDINKLRNMAAHRCEKVLKYSKLDALMCKTVLPFVYETMSCKDYEYMNKHLIGGKEVTEILNPFIVEGQKKLIGLKKIAYLKEIARCTPNISRFGRKLSYEKIEKLSHIRAIIDIDEGGVEEENYICPCCGEKALLKIWDVVRWEYVGDDDVPDEYIENYIEPVEDVVKLKCAYCDFTVNDFVGSFNNLLK